MFIYSLLIDYLKIEGDRKEILLGRSLPGDLRKSILDQSEVVSGTGSTVVRAGYRFILVLRELFSAIVASSHGLAPSLRVEFNYIKTIEKNVL